MTRWVVVVAMVGCAGSREPAPPPPPVSPPPAPQPATTGVVAVIAGDDHTCVRRADQRVWCWGRGSEGQLGVDVPARAEPMEVPALKDASTIALGGSATCGLYGGEVRCLAGAKGLVADPAFAGARVSLLALGLYQSCGVVDGGQVRCVDRDRKSDDIALADVVELGVGASERCARTRDGTVTCWQAKAPPAEMVRGAVSLSVGWVHACAVLGDGTVQCWGTNSDGELGMHGNHSRTPIAVPGITDVIQVSSGVRGTCVRHRTGEVTCFGRMVETREPARVAGVRDATALVLGDHHACTLGRGGAVTCWGANDDGQLGRPPVELRRLAEPVPGLAKITKVLGYGYDDGCAVDQGGDAWCWGTSPVAPDTKLARPTKIAELSGARQLALDYDTACALRADRTLACWGRSLSTTAAKQRDVDEVTVGYTHACIRTGGVVTCWGDHPDRVPAITDATALQADSNATCVARKGRGWQCWDVPDNRDFSDAVSVSSPDGGVACKLLATGRVKCTGYGWWGALGNGVVGKHHHGDWVDVVGLDEVTELAGTHNSQCAIKKDRTLWCWGDVTPMFGLAASRARTCNLGDGPPSPCVMAPTKVPQIAGAVHVMLVGHHSGCVVIEDGTVRCWGAAGTSAWGRTTSAEDAAPVALPP